MKTCKECGSEDIFYDAYVGVNDKNDVRTFESIDCFECGGKDVDTEVKQ